MSAGAFGSYAATGPAEPRRATAAAWIDWAAGAVTVALAFPFPIVRASVELPWFVTSVGIALFSGCALFMALTATLLGRTPGMYLLDLGLEGGRPDAAKALLWGFALATCLPASIGWGALAHPASGLPARLSGLAVVSARQAER